MDHSRSRLFQALPRGLARASLRMGRRETIVALRIRVESAPEVGDDLGARKVREHGSGDEELGSPDPRADADDVLADEVRIDQQPP